MKFAKKLKELTCSIILLCIKFYYYLALVLSVP